jgi:hypothetical protein
LLVCKEKEIIGIPEAPTIYDMMVIGYRDNPPNEKLSEIKPK